MNNYFWNPTELTLITNAENKYYDAKNKGFTTDINKATAFTCKDGAQLFISVNKMPYCKTIEVIKHYDTTKKEWFIAS